MLLSSSVLYMAELNICEGVRYVNIFHAYPTAVLLAAVSKCVCLADGQLMRLTK